MCEALIPFPKGVNDQLLLSYRKALMKYTVMIIRDKALVSVSEKQPNIQINKTLIWYLLKREQ